MPDGSLVVFDAGIRPLVVIGPDSDSLLAAFSNQGQGPGEIWGGYPLLWPAEPGSFWIADRGNNRVSKFSLRGHLLEERPLRSTPGAVSLSWQVLQASGELLAHLHWFDSGGDGAVDSLAWLDPAEGRLHPFVPLWRSEPDRDPTVLNLWRPRSLWVGLPGRTVVTGRNHDTEYHVLGSNGELQRIIRLPLNPKMLTESERAELLQALGEQEDSGRRVEFAPSHPFTDILYAASDEAFALRHTWVVLAEGDEIPKDTFVWRVISVEGQYLGTITFPEGFDPKWTDGRYLLGLQRDSLGVATIQEMRLQRPVVVPG